MRFFEFLPVGRDDGDDETKLPRDLDVGTDYELVVTTLGGLCRYRIGDVVKHVGYHGEAPLVTFMYRAGQVLDVRGEKTSEAMLQTAVEDALGADVAAFAAVERVDDPNPPGYDVLCDYDGDVRAASERLEVALRDANPVYATWRDKGAISPARVLAVDADAFDALRTHKLKEGASPQQLKQSRVLKRLDHVDLLLHHNRPAAPRQDAPPPGTLAGVAEWTRRYF